MRLCSIIAIYFAFLSLASADNGQCRACDIESCLCYDNTIECSWAQDKPVDWFVGCKDYTKLILHPELPYKPKPKSILPNFTATAPKKRTLYSQFFNGLEQSLETLTINRHCVIEDWTFASLKHIRLIEIFWKNSPVLAKSKDHLPDSGDTPVLFKFSLDKVPENAIVLVNDDTFKLISRKKLEHECKLDILGRHATAMQQRFYQQLSLVGNTQQNPIRLSTSTVMSGSETQTLPSSPFLHRRSLIAPLDSRKQQSHTHDLSQSESFQASEYGGPSSDDIDPSSRFRTMDIDRLGSGFGSILPKDSLKRTFSAGQSNSRGQHNPTLDRSTLHQSAGFADINNSAGEISNHSFNSVTMRTVDKPLLWNQKRDDALSLASSEDPEFMDAERKDLGAGSIKDEGSSFNHFPVPVLEAGKDSKRSYSILATPLDIITDLPDDLSKALTATYLFTDDVIANMGNLPNAAPLLGRYGRYNGLPESEYWDDSSF